VLRERVIIRKENVTELQRVQAELRRERVELERDDVA
jgi:stress response protein YsnF